MVRQEMESPRVTPTFSSRGKFQLCWPKLVDDSKGPLSPLCLAPLCTVLKPERMSLF